MFAFNYALGVTKLAFEAATDALHPSTGKTLTIESIEHVEFKNVDIHDTTVLTELDDDDFTLVTAPSGFVLHGSTSDLSVRLPAAIVYLKSCPSDPGKKENAKNEFLLLAGYTTPGVINHEVATTIAEACVQEPSCQSLKRQRELTQVPTSSPPVPVISPGPLSDLVRDDYVTPVDL
jgi:hypothetical protein